MKKSFIGFDKIGAKLLYEILQLRSEVFVVEQQCCYQDLDEKDFQSVHLCFFEEEKLIAYCRLLPKGLAYNECSIGRVVVAKDYRNKGLAAILMKEAIEYISLHWNEITIHISAQTYLKTFYESLGFQQIGEEYDDHGILHIGMIKG